MNVLIVDDEKLQLLRLEEAVKKVMDNVNVISFINPLEALDKSRDLDIDIAFLDIEMPKINGIMLAKTLKKQNPKVNIIFVTAYDKYGLEAMKLHASGYISKPVNEAKIKEELESLRYPIEEQISKDTLVVKCFGNFEVFYQGEPLKFSYSKTKELFAYLIDREGSAININELNAVLWEEDHKSYLRNLISDLAKTLKDLGLDDIFYKRHNECYIDVSKVDCDAYRYKHNDPDAIRKYRGEYMIQYPWAVFKD